jgi:antitoxin component YwqK of YwqJK toxin-antitoxin module
MKKIAVLFGLILAPVLAQSQVKAGADGLYRDTDGSLFTGTLENKENGAIHSEIDVRDGVCNGNAVYYYSSGKTMESGTFVNGQMDGKWLRYNENGTMVGLAIYNLGKKNGTWFVWDDAGKKRFEMNYSLGEKTGTWYNWDENGNVVSEKNYAHAN